MINTQIFVSSSSYMLYIVTNKVLKQLGEILTLHCLQHCGVEAPKHIHYIYLSIHNQSILHIYN
jgi:hypothetical protein